MTLILDIVAIDEREITRDALLQRDLGFDELDVVEFVMALESEFGIAIDDDDGDVLGGGTLGQVFDYLKTHGAKP